VKHFYHGLLFDSHHGAIGHGGCGGEAEALPGEATFPEESALVQNAYRGFLPDLRHDCEFYFSFLYIKNSIRRVALSKDRLLFGKASIFLPPLRVERNVLGSNLLIFLAGAMGVMMAPFSRVPNAQEATSMIKMNESARGGEQRQASARVKLRSARPKNVFTLGVESQSVPSC
jgi:hypothetical protein